MLSILILFILSIFCVISMRGKTKIKAFQKWFSIVVFNFFVIELLVYGYFCYTIYKGNCVFLIGNQPVLDALIKARLAYATYFQQGKKNFILVVDNELGYALGRNKGDVTNSQGLHSIREYQLVPPKDKLRIAVFGASYVFCDGEPTENSWPYILENSVGNTEVINFGVSGYGFGQSYLRYLRDGLRYNPDVVFFQFIRFSGRDSFNADGILASRDLRSADLYRVIFKLQNDVLITRSISPYDLFDKEIMDNYLYKFLRIYKKNAILSQKFLSAINTGLLIKSIILRNELSKVVVKNSEDDYTNEENVKMLGNLLWTIKKNGSMIVFFVKGSMDTLPLEIVNLLNQYKDNALYIDSDIVNLNIAKSRLPMKDLKNSADHFNAKGNKIYAETVLQILKSRRWVSGRAAFEFSDKKNSFVRVTAEN